MTNNVQPKVFIVEDDRFLLDMYVIKFNERGFSVETAFGGQEALDQFAKDEVKPDVVLLDLVMPEVGGFEVLEQVKQKKLLPDSLIIILSNLGQKEDIDRGLALGADGYIVKASATPTEVVNRVLSIMEQKSKSKKR
ncbi:MAG TPA: response regulator [Candidatus Paceibacterota bacterium]